MEMAPKTTPIDRFLAKTVLRLIPYSVRPNHLTVFRFMTIPFIFWFLWLEMYMYGGVVFFMSAFTDALDGALARTRNQCTPWGKLYDPLADKLLVVTSGAVLIVRFLNLYIFLSVLITELLLILNAAYLKYVKKEVPHAHLTGKVKMILQSVGMVSLFIYSLSGGAAFFMFIQLVFYFAIAFGVVSLFVYKSA